MVRLTADLIQNSLSYLNPLNERELDLRGHRIPTIENLGVAGPQDAIDFTDNDIQILGNFPLSPRIQTLLLARNRVSTIQPNLPNAIPNLRNLVLASNQVAELSDLDVLGKFTRLTQLVLADNPVTKKEHYRYWVVWRCPTVRFLDYQKVKQAERDKATELFGTAEEPSELASKIKGIKSQTFNVSAANGEATAVSKMKRLKLTDKEKQRLQERIKKASSLEEIIRLEKELEEGRLPAGILGDDAMEE
ncbi:u2 small nuclear ribonucleoprotein a [Diaporthe amygdali]|uniref:u2 small nuclear ribonucleoprotein a n=1 Tax=Phomopsis amygdali TaxID=1214568 RepID=UPI0022FE27BF|nr:u2 small nuclear ribonucleoprotein a [Diaporthe amygdali]KAJ0115339.1 u2 small nuclear ribonucleoprotein a [Diaporthe amygdali]